MDLHLASALDGVGVGDRASTLYQHLLDAIVDGRLPTGAKVPPTRELAAKLGVSRGTVTTAYDRLTAEGFLVTRVGSGTFVCRDVVPHRTRQAPVGDVRPRAVWATLPSPVPDAPPSEFDLSVGGPDTSLFPLAAWRRLVSATLRPSLLAASAYEGHGDEGLRREIARYAGLSRSVVAGPADVLLTNGAQQALDVVARAVVDPGDVVVVEDPGYTAATRLFALHGARVVGVRVDAEGLVVEDLPRTARIVYVTPSHQFPTGAVMSLRRRIALLEWAARRNAVIVEDDYDSEFRFENRPLAPLQSLDRDGRVVYVGSFSKTLMPSLRVGYLIAPQSLQDTLRQAKLLTDWQGDAVTQGALARFMSEGLLSAHVRRVTRIYAERRTALLRGLASLPAGVLEVLPSAAGLHLCTYFVDRTVDDVAVARAAAGAGVSLEPVSVRFLDTTPRPGLAMGFRRITADQVPAAIRRLGTVLPPP
ncbi:PLP-dependent aminotransferase family protein [Pedococcus bigeumensis]|uniref:PLP-dependent aminotransferase family protein n=1 Tax=Pedococcus bigeumensis TaxID=433644 RepID=A0A502D692_9MICO|nr:PLP-dependent aminotransferase family protein [Pedococcus bigeumensis]TPG19606.1 PLP-dependent aminotransferase family protein [Pedococcus bigeumensis]